MEEILFYFLAAFTAISALLVVVSRNPVNGAMFMILAFVGTAGLFATLGAYILAALQILVYAGAVMVLFLFIIMLIDIPETATRRRSWGTLVAALLAFSAMVGGLTFLFLAPEYQQAMPETGTVEALAGDSLGFSGRAVDYGAGLMSKYMLPVQVVGFLLLVAMIGVIVISKDLVGRTRVAGEPRGDNPQEGGRP